MRKNLLIGIVGFGLGIGATLLYSKKVNLTDEINEEENIEQKIEEANEVSELELSEHYGEMKELFSDCDPEEEHKFITERLKCNKSEDKASKYWRSMSDAEKDVKDAIAKKDMETLLSYTSCDAYDLTWYELHCESDRKPIIDKSFSLLFGHLDELGSSFLSTSIWKRNKPDSRRIRNPRWILRSRLYAKGFKLKNPWTHEPHPTEDGTIILLEQKLDGKIYIVGIPITGVVDEN